MLADYYFFQQKDTFAQNQFPLLVHIAFGAIALATGACNIMLGFKRNTSSTHKILGRIYGVSVFISALAAIYNAQYAFGGMPSRLGFSTLAVLWLATLGASIWNIVVRKNVAWHAFWMIINFSLTFAAVTLRLQIASFAYPPENFELAYPIIAWTCWIPNLIIGFLIARREKAKIISEKLRRKH